MRTKLYFVSLFILAIAAGAFTLLDFKQESVETVRIIYKHDHHEGHHNKKRKRRKRCKPHHDYNQDYQRIKINAHADIVLRRANDPSEIRVDVEGCGIKKEIHGGVLHISSDRKDCQNNNPIVYITHGELSAVDHNGSGNLQINSPIYSENFVITSSSSGNVFVEEIHTPELKTYIKGSADILVKGNVDRLHVLSYGSGNFRGYQLTCEELNADIKGSGDVMATVNDEINPRIYGSGDLKIKGDVVIPANSSDLFRGSGQLYKVK